MKIKFVKITELLEKRVFSGYSFRSKVENKEDGNLHVIQMKDIENNYSTIGRNLIKIAKDKIDSKHYLKYNDILFMSKGSNNCALVYTLKLPAAIAVSAFFVLRPNQEKVVPKYLTWYMNQSDVQRYLKAYMVGTYIPNVDKKTVENIHIKLPSLDIQKKIADVSDLMSQEEQIMIQLRKQRKSLLMHVIK